MRVQKVELYTDGKENVSYILMEFELYGTERKRIKQE